MKRHPARRCENPWNEACDSGDILVYIRYAGAQKPICRACWRIIAETEVEWG